MITKEQSEKLKELITEHANAMVANAFPGYLSEAQRYKRLLRIAKARRELNEFIRHIDGSSKRIGS